MHDLCMNARQFYHDHLPGPLHGEQRWETGMETKCGVIIYQKKKKKQIYFAHFFLGSEGREIKNFLKKIPKPCSKWIFQTPI